MSMYRFGPFLSNLKNKRILVHSFSGKIQLLYKHPQLTITVIAFFNSANFYTHIWTMDMLP